VVRWIGGERDAALAAEAWNGATRMPLLHISHATPPVAVGGLGAVVAIYLVARPSLFAFAVLSAGGLVAVALGIAIHMVSTGALMRPVLAEIDAAFPDAALRTPPRGSSLRPRIVVSSLLVVIASSWLTGGLVAHVASPTATLTIGIGSGLGVGVVFGLILTTALGQSIFDPLRALTAATRRVQQGDLTTRVPVVADDELGTLSQSFNAMVDGLAEREALRSALGTYVEPSIAERLLSEGEFLKGEEIDVTIMFVDIVGFSARAEFMPADAVCTELNEFFQIVVPIVADHGGHTNKLIGDGLMAVFGTPVRCTDHADRALRAAFEIQKQLSERYRGSLCAGVGLNSGSVVVGTMGGGTKLDFTVIGDAVNVASRVEALTRTTGDDVLLTEATKDALRTPVVLASRGPVTVRGRAEQVSIYAPVTHVPA
jgi:class 3 adenylate cyclase